MFPERVTRLFPVPHACGFPLNCRRKQPVIIDHRNLERLAQPWQQPGAAAGVTIDADALPATRPRHGAVFFLHRFGSALNRHVHLHVCATDGVFVPNGDGRPAFLPAHPITQVHLVTLTERVRRRVIRWFRLAHLLDASWVAAMFAWENSGFSIDASVRIALNGVQLRVYCQPLEHLLRYCARPPFALERLSVTRAASGQEAVVTRIKRPARTTRRGLLGSG